MPEYALLLLPSTNRVYRTQAGELTLAELAVTSTRLHAPIEQARLASIGGVDYVRFRSDGFDEHDRAVVSDVSAAFALFRLSDDEQQLAPVPLEPTQRFGSDLITVQRYPGKTNEQFTHLLVNVAWSRSPAAAERAAAGRPIRLLDPLAGRGTSLNRGLMYGFDVAGVEINGSDIDAYVTFLSHHLKESRRPFKVETSTVRRGAAAGAKRSTITIGPAQRVELVRDDTTSAAHHFAAHRFDLLVADLPYGVQHGAASGGGRNRSPGALVSTAAPVWRSLLRTGAGIALAWNTKTMPRPQLEASLRDAGFTVVDPPLPFGHDVDRSIHRDVMVATV